MNVNSAALYAQQQAQSQLQIGQAVMKSNAKAEQKVAAILAEAVESTPAPGAGRGTNLDISV